MKFRILLCLLLAVGSVFKTYSETPDAEQRKTSGDARHVIGRALDLAQKHVDEYGTLNVSAPILTLARSNEFAFNLTNDAAFFFNDEKTNLQGRAALFSQSSQLLQISAQAQFDPTIAAAYDVSKLQFASDNAAFGARQDAFRKAADAQLQADLATAATNTSVNLSNAAVATAYRNYATNLYSSGAPPTYPTSASANGTNLPAPPSALAGQLTNTNNGLQPMKEFLGLLNSGATGVSIPNRSALLEAAGDNAIASFFRSLGNWNLYTNFLNRQIYYGAVTVSVDPGWRTKAGWAGEVNVRAELAFSEARRPVVARVLSDSKIPIELRLAIAEDYGYPCDDSDALKGMEISAKAAEEISKLAAKYGKHPCPLARAEASIPHSLVRKVSGKPVETMVISPMVEADNFDLAASYRTQSEFALYLAAAMSKAGAKGQAEMFERFAKSRQNDIGTRAAIATVNAYSGQEGSFGFQFGPSIRALKNPGNNSTGSGTILERQSFPALIIVTVSTGELEPRISVADGQFRVHEPYLAFRQTRRWIPLERNPTTVANWYKPRQWFHPRLDEHERMDAVEALEEANTRLADLRWNTPLSMIIESSLADGLKERIRGYERQLIGTVDTFALPPEFIVPEMARKKDVKIERIEPQDLDFHDSLRSAPTFTLLGANLDLVASVAAASPNITNIVKASSGSGYYTFTATITDPRMPVFFKVNLNDQATQTALFPDPVFVRRRTREPEIMEVFPRSVAVKKDSKDAPQPTEVSLIYVGKQLAFLDITAVKPLGDNATVLSAERVGEAIKVKVKVTDAKEAIVLKFPSDGPHSRTLIAPGVQVNLEAAAAKDVKKPEEAAGGGETKKPVVNLDALSATQAVITLTNLPPATAATNNVGDTKNNQPAKP